MSFWLPLLAFCLVEALGAFLAIRRELLEKEKRFTVDERQR
jgi:hypothetical protein